MSKRVLFAVVATVVISLAFSVSVFGRAAIDMSKGFGPGSSTAGAPAFCLTQHDVGQIVLAINNNGTFGTGFAAGTNDCFTGAAVRSCEYPKNSSVEYLFAGAFWIGAVLGRDTLVSVGADGWIGIEEMYPDEAPFGNMIHRSIIDPSAPEYEGAISEEDFIATYSDTYTEGIDPDEDGRAHRPLNIEATQTSYAWSYSYAEDIVLFDYKITNIGFQRLDSVYMGLYVDADVCFDCGNTQGFADDVCGFVETRVAKCEECEYTEDVNIAWIADADGDFNALTAAPHVTGMRIVRTPADSLEVSFNWWISNGNVSLDFGPREKAGVGRWKEEFRQFRTGGLGTPSGDRDKYYVLRNQEFDYDQVYTASIKQTDSIWLYPEQSQAADFANGYDTRYLLSFGPFDINPGDQLPISFAYIAGENFHTDRNNISNLPSDPDKYIENLNFDSLGANAKWASWMYDNPGVDTDSDGYSGEIFVCVSDSSLIDSTIESISTDDPPDTVWSFTFEVNSADTCWITGDGIPDFRGASPPPSPSSWSNFMGVPAMRVIPEQGQIRIRFNGLRSEITRDVFSGDIDFEGYRVYMSRDDRSASYSVLASYDIEDYNKFIWNLRRPGGAGYQLLDIPYTAEQLRCAYGDSCNDTIFDPLAYSSSNPFVVDNPDTIPDSLFYFLPQDFNVSKFGEDTRIIRVPEYANAPYPSTLIPENADSTELTEDGFFKYFEYEIVIEDLLPTVPLYVNVTAFDFGSPASGLPSLESALTLGSQFVYPMAAADEVESRGLKAYVYPNPYRGDADYSASNFEAKATTEFSQERQRRIHFANLPDRCTIRIYSLDGDLVREIEHVGTGGTDSHETWDLVTRNTQAAVSGLYYWVLEREDGSTQIGKLVLIM